MLTRPRTIIAACGIGADLHLAVVEVSPMGARVRSGPVVRDAAHAGPDALRRAGAGLPRTGTIVFICPAELAAVRPIGVDARGFLHARADLVRSIGRLVPIPAENALVGHVQRDLDAESGESAGFIYAARRDAIDAWSDRIRTITGRTPDAVLTPAMALLGVGGQRTETLIVLERSLSGAVAHTLRFGKVLDLAQPVDSERLATLRASGAIVRELPTGAETSPEQSTTPITGEELAVAGAMAMVIGDGAFVPLAGAPPRSAPRWAAAAALLLAAGILAWGASSLRSWRYERAIERLAAEEARLDAEVARVQSMRAETANLIAMLRDGVQASTRAWSPRTSDIAAAAAVVPATGFLYELTVNPAGVVLKGEALKASDVLRALEDSPRFTKARPQDPTQSVMGRDAETFGLAADYEKPAPAEGSAK